MKEKVRKIFFDAIRIFGEKIIGSPMYSKNQAVMFTVIFLVTVSLFFSAKIKHYFVQIKNPYVKNITQALAQPLTDFSETLPLENFFANTREKVLKICGVQNDYHWDNFYYSGKTALTVVADKSANSSANSESQTNTARTFTQTDLTAPKIETTQPPNNSLVAVRYDYTREHPLRILFAGDSQMQSIAEGFKRNIGTASPFAATELAVVSSGFIRTDYYNWPAKLTALLEEAENESRPFDAVVLLLGMNDYQNFFDGNGKLFRSGSDAWIDAYIKKIQDVMDILQRSVKKIYWLGLPIVKSPLLNSQITAVEQAQVKAMAEMSSSKVRRISLRKMIFGESGVYTDKVQTADGKRIQLMREDGVHYSLAGGSFLMSKVAEYFYQDFRIEK